MRLQKSRLDTPFSTTLVDHEGRAEAEHDGDEIRRREGPGRRARAQALRGDFGSVRVANG